MDIKIKTTKEERAVLRRTAKEIEERSKKGFTTRVPSLEEDLEAESSTDSWNDPESIEEAKERKRLRAQEKAEWDALSPKERKAREAEEKAQELLEQEAKRKIARGELRDKIGFLCQTLADPLPTKEVKTEWIEENWIPLAEVTVLDGAPSSGKGIYAHKVAAKVSTECVAMILSKEDSGYRIRGQIECQGGDVGNVRWADRGTLKSMLFPKCLPQLELMIAHYGAKFVVIDTLHKFLEYNMDMNSAKDMNIIMSRLSEIAYNTGAGIMVVRHTTKGKGLISKLAGAGSVGITGGSRAEILLKKGKSGIGTAELSKSSMTGKEGVKRRFRLEGQSEGIAKLIWLEDANQEPVAKKAIKWLIENVGSGELTKTYKEECAKTFGISEEYVKKLNQKRKPSE